MRFIDHVYRCRPVPERSVGHNVVVAQPRTGLALLLPSTAALIWDAAKDWVSMDDLERVLATSHPDIQPSERHDAVGEITSMLHGEGLLERRPS